MANTALQKILDAGPSTEWLPSGDELDRLFKIRLQGFDDALQAHLRGDLDEAEFRPIRLGMGIYGQLPHVNHMFRIKIPAGIFTSEQVYRLSELCDEYGRSQPHISTRQNVQFHWVPLEKGTDLFARLWEVGIETIGASADGARNVTADPYGGVDPEEVLDSTPYALMLNAFYRFHKNNMRLPKKYKIAVSGSALDRAQVGLNDAGFLAVEQNGVKGFEVFAGGGLGAFPIPALRVQEFIPASDILIAADALMRLYHDHGIRKPRSKARIKFLVQKMGPDKFRDLYWQYYTQSEQDYGPELRRKAAWWLDTQWQAPVPVLPPDSLAERPVDHKAFDAWKLLNAMAQKQAGYYAVTVKLALGDLDTTQFRLLADLAVQFGNGIMRATDSQKLVLPFIPEGCLPGVYARLRDGGLAEAGAGLLSDVVCCPGADFCSLAITKSKSFATRVRETLAEGGVDEMALGPFPLQMSGCPNACAQHNMTWLGATGMMLKDEQGNPAPHYSFFVGGVSAGVNSRVGVRLRGRYPEAVGPAVITALTGDYLTQRRTGETYPQYIDRVGIDHINDVATALLEDK